MNLAKRFAFLGALLVAVGLTLTPRLAVA